jgi:hypothetical protein
MTPARRAHRIGHAALIIAALVAGAGGAAGQPPGAPRVPPRPAAPPATPTDVLIQAGAALGAGEHERAATLAARVARDPRPVDRQDRAEAWRILGLAQYALGRKGEAEISFYAHLKLDPDAHLDPAVVSSETVAFFENVRAQHAAELAALRPRPARRRNIMLNFVPLGGQWQNGDRTKMWVLGSAGAVLLGVNVGSYLMLRSWCGSPGRTSTCDEGEPGMPGYQNHTDAARRMKLVNIASGVGLLAVYAYSFVDGMNGYRHWQREQLRAQPPVTLGVSGDRDSVLFTVGGGF